MKKGLSPVIAIVLMIAIAVIASVSVFFWMGSMVSERPTSEKPTAIQVQEGRNGTFLVANLGKEKVEDESLSTDVIGVVCNFTEETGPEPGGQELCILQNESDMAPETVSGEIRFYGEKTTTSKLSVSNVSVK